VHRFGVFGCLLPPLVAVEGSVFAERPLGRALGRYD
jgi:hypothetical protein